MTPSFCFMTYSQSFSPTAELRLPLLRHLVTGRAGTGPTSTHRRIAGRQLHQRTRRRRHRPLPEERLGDVDLQSLPRRVAHPRRRATDRHRDPVGTGRRRAPTGSRGRPRPPQPHGSRPHDRTNQRTPDRKRANAHHHQGTVRPHDHGLPGTGLPRSDQPGPNTPTEKSTWCTSSAEAPATPSSAWKPQTPPDARSSPGPPKEPRWATSSSQPGQSATSTEAWTNSG